MDTLISGLGVVLALILGFSGSMKLKALERAEQSLHALRVQGWGIRPEALVGIVCSAELLCALGLLVTRGIWFVATGFAVWAITVFFLGVVVRAARLGSTQECGCFGDVLPSTIGRALALRNVALVFASSIVLGAASVSLLTGGAPSALSAFPESVGAIATGVVAFVCGVAVMTKAASDPPMPPTQNAQPGDEPRAVVLAADGEAVDPVQRALSGRAQLLVFIRPTCSSCAEIVASLSARPLKNVDPLLIETVGDGSTFYTDEGGEAAPVRVRSYADLAGRLAHQLGIPSSRPAAVLVTTQGSLLHPIAEGRDQALALISAVFEADGAGDGASGREVAAPITGEPRPTLSGGGRIGPQRLRRPNEGPAGGKARE